MKLINLCMTLAIAIAPVAYAGDNHDATPKHGGKVTTVKDIDAELVLKQDSLRLYLRDHGKSISVKNGEAKVTLLRNGISKDYALTPRSEHFEYVGDVGDVTNLKAIVVIKLNGKVLSGRFTF